MVTLRTKQIAGNRQRLYLDFYPAIPHPVTGKPTRREFLELFLYNEIEHEEKKYLDENGKEQKKYVPVYNRKDEPKKIKLNPIEKNHNSETEKLAENISAKRQLAIQAGNYGFLAEDKKLTDFLAYFKELADKHKAENKADKYNWLSVYNYLVKFTHGNCTAADITETFCNEFKEYLQSTDTFRKTKKQLRTNSASGYFAIFRASLKKAYLQKILTENIFERIKSIKNAETQREFLTNAELQQLAKADCVYPDLKNASLFSALTGLRYSDIEKLVWGEVQQDKAVKGGKEIDIFFIRFTQKKTRGIETLPISEQAFQLLGQRGEAHEKVFKSLLYNSWQNFKIQEWITNSGIKKHITFHNFRHTYATLQLTFGTDIYTVSKMLGHRNLQTTQVYAKIIDQTKREAADKIKLDF